MSDNNDGLAPVQKAITDLSDSVNKKLDTFVTKSDLEKVVKAQTDLANDVKVVKSNFIEDRCLGLPFQSGGELVWHIIKAAQGIESSKELIYGAEGYLPKVKAYCAESPKAKASGQNEAIDSQGGIFVLPEYAEGFVKTGPTLANIRQYSRVIPMNTNLYRLRALVDKNHSTSPYGGITVTRGPEAGTITSSKAQWEMIELKPSDLTGLSYVTNDLLEDAAAFMSYLPSLFMGAMDNSEQASALYGNGAGDWLGALSSTNPALVTVAKTSGQTAATITAANIFAMRARCWGYENAVWLSSVDNIPQFASFTTGQIPVYLPNMKAAEGFDTMLGRPILFTEHMKTTGTLNDIALVNLSQYAIGDRGGVKSDQSIHVKFTTNEMALRFVKRNDGQPLWRAPLTPVSGSNTLSPFVNLAARA